MTEQLNVLLADTMTLRDLYKKSHWQVAGPTFYQLHLLYDKHYEEQAEIVDTIAERIQLLGGVRSRWPPTLRRPRASRVRQRAGKKFLCRFRACSMRTRLIIGDCRELGGPRTRTRRRRHQRYGDQRRAAHQRIAGLVHQRTSGRCAAGACSGARCPEGGIVCSSPVRNAGPPEGPHFPLRSDLPISPPSRCRGRNTRTRTSVSRHLFSRCANPPAACLRTRAISRMCIATVPQQAPMKLIPRSRACIA